jgi:nucleoside-diphosphate-sugar epimerase
VRVVVTGGAGFIARAVVRTLVARGGDVVAIVRDPARAGDLAGASLVAGDLSSVDELRAQLRGADAVVHLAGVYRVGITPAERPAMLDANVGATERVIDAAVAANVPRIVYVSTVNVFGNTRGRIVDEAYRRDPAGGFVSYYDETKYRAHNVALARIADGAPIVIVQPGTVYGPGDHSAIGAQLEQAYHGTLRYRALGDVGITPVHVDDVAAGIVAALERGAIGQAYVMAGSPMRLAQALDIAARAGDKRLPRLRIPSLLVRAASAIAGLVPTGVADQLGLPPNIREVISAADGVTYWASSARAERELGFRARPLEAGVRDVFGSP